MMSNGNREKLTITLDTNTIIDYANSKDDNVRKIWQLFQEEKIVIVKTDVVDTELKSRRAKQVSDIIKEDIGYAVLDHSRWDHTKCAPADFGSELDGILKTIWPDLKDRYQATRQQIRDAMSLHTHRLSKRDVFVTKDRVILRARKKLANLQIVVRSPTEFVTRLETLGIS